MLQIILFSLAIAAIAGISGYKISHSFYRTDYSKTNTSGDFGGPRGGFVALMAGMLIGIMASSICSYCPLFSADATSTGMLVAMVVGAGAGIVGMIRATKARRANKN